MQTDANTTNSLDRDLADKYHALQAALRATGNIAVAFSGGVDSALLLKTAHDTLGDAAIAVTACARVFPEREIAAARTLCETDDIPLITFDSRVCDNREFLANPPDRCYICKKIMLAEIIETANKKGFTNVAEGSNLDDKNDRRPGFAAVRELDVMSPLQSAHFTKDNVRTLARYLGLPVWDKPAFACLATRIPHGEEITPEKLARIDAAEQILIDYGFEQVRVRSHRDLARIEVAPEKITQLIKVCKEHDVTQKLKDLGFDYVRVDPLGYKSGGSERISSGTEHVAT